MLVGRVGESMVGSPYGLGKVSGTGDSSGGRPCGVVPEGSGLSVPVLELAGSLFCDVVAGRGRDS